MKIKLLLATLFLGLFTHGQVPTTDLVKEYLFTNGNLQNTVNPGTYDLTHGTTQYILTTDLEQIANNAVDCNGQEFNAGQHPTTDGNFTYSFWIKTSSNVNTDQYLIRQFGSNGFPAGNRLYLRGGILYWLGDFRIGGNYSATTSPIGSSNIADNSWHHITVTGKLRTNAFGNTTLRRFKYLYEIYVDGILDASGFSGELVNDATSVIDLFYGTPDLTIGSAQFLDEIDNFRVYTRALTPLEVTNLFQEMCIVNIPDANFKAYLVNNSAINTNGDTEISCSEAAGFTGRIDCNALSISDLTGIEAFTALTQLRCYNNQLTSIDVSANTNLFQLWCYNNQLTNLDISANTNLNLLRCYNNQLTSIDVSANTNLSQLNCGGNNLSSLDVSANTSLTILECDSNQLTSLNVSNNTTMTRLSCSNNQISSLDLSNNSALEALFCGNNLLTSLNMANSNNSNMSIGNFVAINNTNLICVTVDNVTYSTTNWTNIDSQTNFSINCNAPCIVNIPDVNFKSYLVSNSSINTNGDTEIQCSEASAVTGTLDCTSRNISDLTGIEAFIGITQLRCYGNQLTSLDISSNTALEQLFAFSNQLTSLNISSNTVLWNLDIHNNQLATLNTSNNSALEVIDCSNNPNISLNLSNNIALKNLSANNNQLTIVDISANINLEGLVCTNNLITSLDVSSNTKLVVLNCTDNQLTNIDLSNNPDLYNLVLSRNQLTNLNVSSNTKLFQLIVDNNQITTINVSNNPYLERIAVYNNQITSLDLTSSIVLNRVFVQDNNLFFLNVANGNNTNISTNLFNTVNNPNLTCVTVDNVAYSTTNWLNIDAQTSFSANCSTLGIDDFILNNISIYPNPVLDTLSIQIEGVLDRIEVYTLQGQKIIESAIPTISVSEFPSGLYILKVITSDGKVGLKRFVKK